MNPASALVASNAVAPTPAAGAPPQAAGQAIENSFKKLLQNLPIQIDGLSEAVTQNPKASGKLTRKNPSDENGKLALAVMPVAVPAVPPKAPLVLKPPSLGPAQQEKTASTDKEIPEPVALEVRESAPLLTHAPLVRSAGLEQIPVMESRALTSGAAAPAPESASPRPASNISVPLRPENLAFSLRLAESDAASRQATALATRAHEAPHLPATNVAPRHTPIMEKQSTASRSQPTNDTKNPSRPLAPIENKESLPPNSTRDFFSQSPSSSNTASTMIHMDSRSSMPPPEPVESIHTNPPIAVREVKALTPEPPRVNMNSEILLHLVGKDQTSAAVRVMDRGGAVNVSVHAPDPELRNSLRSNLGELASQLNNQGWKTEVVTTTPAPSSSEHSRGSGPHDDSSSGQQQPSGNSERQSQRDRRPSDRWLQEFEEQTTGNTGNSGGNN
jgi:hypothetical protein